MTTPLSKEEMDAMDSNDKSDHDIISTEMLENIRDGNQSHPNANQRGTCYKRCDRTTGIEKSVKSYTKHG